MSIVLEHIASQAPWKGKIYSDGWTLAAGGVHDIVEPATGNVLGTVGQANADDVDRAARVSLEADGFGPGYKLPGLPHRTGHGIGLDIHEWPYLVGNDTTPLDVGMCFSNEPMICIPGEFGIRHEDHFYMTENGPRWFTQPAHSIDDPFGLQA